MKTLTFTYTKKDHSVSSRTLLAMVFPGDKYAGIDVSELDPTDAAEFVSQVKEAHEEYLVALNTLQERFDLKFSYRQFLADGISNLNEI